MLGRYDWYARFSGDRLRRSLKSETDHPGMPLIPPHDLNCAFYLYPDRKAAESGQKIGGSGFWVAVRSVEVSELWWLYGVSNAHVVHRHGASVIRANAKNGGVTIIESEPTDWTEHPKGHDVAILPVDGKMNLPEMEVVPVAPGMFITEDDVNFGFVNVGDEAYLIGRFINHEGKAKNTPSARFGNISMMPGEPIYIDAMTRPQESFVVELRSMCGYSGSPVFVHANTARNFRPSAMGPDALLGVHWGNISEPWPVETKIVRQSARTGLAPDEREIDLVYANTGMNGVVPAWYLMELLNMPKFKSIRDQEEADEKARRKRENPGATLQSASAVSSPHATDANPKHREDFTSLVGAAARKREPED